VAGIWGTLVSEVKTKLKIVYLKKSMNNILCWEHQKKRGQSNQYALPHLPFLLK
jgi:hypothetical protein